MPLTPQDITFATGKLYAHVFENRPQGVPRGLYWNLSLDCSSIRWGRR